MSLTVPRSAPYNTPYTRNPGRTGEKGRLMEMERNKRVGLTVVTSSYVLWGLLPIFWGTLAAVNSVYVLAQRIVWSMVFMGLYMLAARQWGEIREAFRNRKLMGRCLICGALITFNWGLYIYSVNSGHVLEGSMGYFIEPMLVGLIGIVVFRERPSFWEDLTLLCAGIGIGYLILRTGQVPVLALMIGLPFAVYGAVKKGLPLSAQASLFLETLLMMPFALGFSLWWSRRAGGLDNVLDGASFWLLPLCGVVTSVPLLLFNMGVKAAPYYFTGILMYINPTLQFLMGLFYFQETLDKDRLIAFLIIWVGILFTIGEKVCILLREGRKVKALIQETKDAGPRERVP